MSEYLKIIQTKLNTVAETTGIENDNRENAIQPEIIQDEQRLQILQEELKKAEEVITFLRGLAYKPRQNNLMTRSAGKKKKK